MPRRRERIVYNGEPGDEWVNDTGQPQYQFIVNWTFSCGICAQYDHAIGPSWPIPVHRNCRCVQHLILPGATAAPFVDFQAHIQKLNRAQQSAVIGRSNLQLVEAGTVQWSDVVTRSRVRPLYEVVAERKLSVDAMTKAGVNSKTAADAHAWVNTPAHAAAEAHREKLTKAILDKGVEREALKQAAAERLAARVSIKAGPSGPQAMPITPTPLKVPAPPPVEKPAPKPKKTPPPIAAKPTPKPAPVPQLVDHLVKKLGVKPEVVAEIIAPKAAAPPATPLPRYTIDGAKAYAESLGIKVQPKGFAGLVGHVGEAKAKRMPAAFSRQANEILINEEHRYWADPVAYMKESEGHGYFSTGEADHIIVHEVGHALHFQTAPKEYEKVRLLKFKDPSDNLALAGRVSDYATSKPVEFVAEVYAGLSAGKTYDDEVLGLYNHLSGPAVKGSQKAAATPKVEPEPPPAPKPHVTAKVPEKPKPLAPPPVPPKPAQTHVSPEPPKSSEWRPADAKSFEQLTSAGQIESWGAKDKATIDALPKIEREALQSYSGNTFIYMNDMLRGNIDKVPKSVRKEVEKLIVNAKAALEKGQTDRDLMMYRGMSNYTKAGFKSIDDFKPGLVFKEAGFGSSSLDRGVGIQFASPDADFKHVLFEVRVPAGSSGLYLNAGGIAKHEKEREFVAPPDAEYRVVGPGKKAKNQWGEETDVVILERVK